MKSKQFLLLIPFVVMFSFGMDTYVPFLLEIGRDFHATDYQMQLTLTSYFLALAIGQIPAGYFADLFGRKIILVFSALLFVVASWLCMHAASLEWLVFFRFIQGFGACGARVTAYIMVKDNYDGDSAATKLTLLYSIVSISPTIAPFIGGVFGEVWGWQAIFWILVIVGLLSIGLSNFMIDVYQKPQKGVRSNFGLNAIWRVMRDPQILVFSVFSAVAMSLMFCFISSIVYIVREWYGLPKIYLYLSFLIVGMWIFIAGQMSRRWISLYGRYTVFLWVFSIIILGCAALWLFDRAGILGYWGFIVLLGVLLASAVILNGCSIGMGLDGRTHMVGLAIAVIGTLGYGTAGIVGWIMADLGVSIENYALVMLVYCALAASILMCYKKTQNKDVIEN